MRQPAYHKWTIRICPQWHSEEGRRWCVGIFDGNGQLSSLHAPQERKEAQATARLYRCRLARFVRSVERGKPLPIAGIFYQNRDWPLKEASDEVNKEENHGTG